jgi:hypothetical protein
MADRKTKLQVVRPDETAANPSLRSKSVVQAATSGDQRELLVAMRDRVARAVSNPDCPPRDLASLTRRLQDIVKDIAMLDTRAAQEPGAVDGGEVDDRFDPAAI